MHRAVVQILQVMATEGLRRSSLGTIPPRSPRASTCQCSFWCSLCDYHIMAKCLFFKFVFSHDSNWFGFPNPKLLWGPWLPCIAQPFLSLSPVYELPFLIPLSTALPSFLQVHESCQFVLALGLPIYSFFAWNNILFFLVLSSGQAFRP